ncbi:UNVERIFIED_CONTAM: hypothetical protein FKN15_038691 [Acipenser sinensis]
MSRVKPMQNTTVGTVMHSLSHSDTELYKNLPGTDSSSRDSRGDITVDQSPPAISVVPGQTVTIKCKASQVIGDDMELYQFKPGHAPKMLIYDGNTLVTGTPSRFSGTWSGADHTFTISNVQSEDDAEYHCGQSDALPFTQ